MEGDENGDALEVHPVKEEDEIAANDGGGGGGGGGGSAMPETTALIQRRRRRRREGQTADNRGRRTIKPQIGANQSTLPERAKFLK